ncbi:MAG: hypothetical protein AAGB22_07885 [Bacteroidota bacterium]
MLLLAVLSFTGACGDDDGTTAPCGIIWQATTDQPEATVAIRQGALVLEVEDAVPPRSASALQGRVFGDFTATATFEQFSAGEGVGGYARLILRDLARPDLGEVQAALGDFQVRATVGDSTRQQAAVGTSGSFTITRSGAEVTVITTSGGSIISLSRDYIATPVTIGFEVGSDSLELAGRTGIHITDFQIISSDTSGFFSASSDAFDCPTTLRVF